MSVTIYWRLRGESSRNFSGGTSTSLDRLAKVFGESIHTGDVATLRAMAVAADDPFYAEVADVVERVGAIKFWAEW